MINQNSLINNELKVENYNNFLIHQSGKGFFYVPGQGARFDLQDQIGESVCRVSGTNIEIKNVQRGHSRQVNVGISRLCLKARAMLVKHKNH